MMRSALICYLIFQPHQTFSLSPTNLFNNGACGRYITSPVHPYCGKRTHSSSLNNRFVSVSDKKVPFCGKSAFSNKDGFSLYQTKNQNDDDANEGLSFPNKNSKSIAKIIVPCLALAITFWKRDLILSSARSFDTSKLTELMITKLDELNGLGYQGLVAYAILFSVWEIAVGITTPVETAAGMAFGIKRGIIASAIGKMGGAVLAFLIGRYALQDYVQKKLEGNEMMDLVEDSIKENPIGVALIWRFSFLPEFIKNFGLALLPLRTIHFMTAVFLHGFPFTCLWTCLGAEARKSLTLQAAPSQTLKIMVTGVYILGFFVSPTLVGLWIKSLRDKQLKKKRG